MNYIKSEFLKLAPICLFLIVSFNYKIGLILSGLFLLAEHMYSYGRWDIKDILGHENLGIVLLLIGLYLNNNYHGMIYSLIIYLAFSNYKWTSKLTPLQYAKSKIINGFKNK